MRIDSSNIGYINPSLKYSIKEYMSLDDRILLYEMLLFCSIISKTPMMCAKADVEAFKKIFLFCKESDIDPKVYVSHAYTYIAKYTHPGHRTGIGYFLNPKVIQYVGASIKTFADKENLFYISLLDDILSTEKVIRDNIEPDKTYLDSLLRQSSKKQVSQYFIAYKKFTKSAALQELEVSKYLQNLISVLEPFFTHFLASKYIYTPYNISSWNNSKIEDYNFCPIFFKDRYVTNELVESVLGNSSTQLGTKLHKIFEDIFKKYKVNPSKGLQTVALNYFKSKACKEVLEDPDIAKDHFPFIKSLFEDKTSVIYSLINENSKIFIEHTMKLRVSDEIEFYGTADLIVVNGDTATVVDYKSSKLDPKYMSSNNKKYLKQLSLYSKLFQHENPDIKKLNICIIYTRGKIVPFDELLEDIVEQRTLAINNIKRSLSTGVLIENKSSCFLCRHPACSKRYRESIWDADGNKRIKN